MSQKWNSTEKILSALLMDSLAVSVAVSFTIWQYKKHYNRVDVHVDISTISIIIIISYEEHSA